MKRQGIRRAAVVLLTALLLVAFGIGCTKYASEDDLQNLERQRQAALSAERKVEQLKSEKAELERTVTQKEAELKKVQAEKAAVSQRAEDDSSSSMEGGN